LGVSRYATLQEMLLQSTTAEGGAGGADSDSVLYTTTARTNVPVRCLGYIDIETGSTPGQWPNAPFFGSLLGPGSKRTGDIVQVVSTLTSTGSSGSVTIPLDSTIPQITEGDQYLSLPISPTSEINILDIDAQGIASNGNTARMFLCLFYASVSNAMTCAVNSGVGNDDPVIVHAKIATVAGRASSITFSMRMGTNVAGTTRFNASSAGAAPYFGGKENSYIIIKEIMA